MYKILIIFNNLTHFFFHKGIGLPVHSNIDQRTHEGGERTPTGGLAATGYHHKTVGTCEVANLITCKCAEILNV